MKRVKIANKKEKSDKKRDQEAIKEGKRLAKERRREERAAEKRESQEEKIIEENQRKAARIKMKEARAREEARFILRRKTQQDQIKRRRALQVVKTMEEAGDAALDEGDRLQKRAEKFEHLEGRLFEHPITARIYEVVHVYWDVDKGRTAAYRSPADGGLPTLEDTNSYAIEGKGNIAELIQEFDDNLAIKNTQVKWPYNEEEMRTLQLADDTLGPIMERIETMPTIEVQSRGVRAHEQQHMTMGKMKFMWGRIYILKNDKKSALRLRTADKIKIENEEWCGNVIALPTVLIPMVLKMAHFTSGHAGIARMIPTLRLQYWWPTLIADVTRVVNRCRSCLLRKADRRGEKVPLKKYIREGFPAARWHIDLMGPFQETLRGNRYIFMAVDAFTRNPEGAAIPSKEMDVVTECNVY